uniref:A2 mating type protein n=1 Tax=Heterobasidion irregulare TaxID=984962 RepID=S5RVT3_9AGAM|nr:a2 mating type protein [Heterobasidion irregulare]
MPSIRENDFLNDFPRVISILSQLCLRISGSREFSLVPVAECNGSADRSSPTAYYSPQRCLSLTLPRPLTSDLLALGLPLMMVQDISDTYMNAATRLKAKLEARFEPRGADSARLEMKLLDGFSVARSQVHVRTIFASHFKRTVASWAEVGMLSTQRWLQTASLKNRLQSCSLVQPAREEAYVTTLPHTDRRTPGTTLFDIFDKTEPSTPCIPIGKKTKHSASLVTRYSTISSCDGTLDQTIPELARLAPVIKPYLDAGLKSNQGAAIKGPKPQRSASQNPSPTSWDLTSLIDDFDGLSIRDRSKSVGLKGEDGTCKATPSKHIFTLSKDSSSPIIRLPTSAGVQSKASSSRPSSSLQSSHDIHSSHSASSQSFRRRKMAPCPNRDRSMQSTYKGPDVLFSRQTDDTTVTSSAANAKELSDLTSHCLPPPASSHTRRRKIAPLPPRHLSTTTTDIAVIISPDLRRSSQRPPHKPFGSRQSATGTSGCLTGPLSRSPSLTSLSSDESGLSCSDELETPPSSPTLPSMILPTTSSAVSLSSGEYRFLSATCLRNMFPAPQLLAVKAENPRPRTFTFSARDEDSPRFPFSR